MKKQIKEIQRSLHELSVLQQKTDVAEKNIRESAALRLDWVNVEILRLRSRVLIDKKAEQQYHELVLERGKLKQVASLDTLKRSVD